MDGYFEFITDHFSIFRKYESSEKAGTVQLGN